MVKFFDTSAESEFSSLLFDTLFGLILFFNIEAVLIISEPFLLVWYVFTILIVVHWWLIFKSVNDRFSNEVNNSILEVVLGLVYIYFIMLIVLHTQNFKLHFSTLFLALLFLVDICWGLIWRFVGKWETKNKARIQAMEKDLDRGIKLDAVFLVIFSLLYFVSGAIDQGALIALLIVSYLSFLILTVKYRIISFDYF